jgi:hypothetical protein
MFGIANLAEHLPPLNDQPVAYVGEFSLTCIRLGMMHKLQTKKKALVGAVFSISLSLRPAL